MEALLAEVKEHRKVKDSTLLSYKRSLNKVATDITGRPFENTDFIINEYDNIKSYLEQGTKSTIRKYASALLVSVSPRCKNDCPEDKREVYDKLKELVMQQNTAYESSIENNSLSESDKRKWCSWASILGVRNSLRKATNSLEKTHRLYDETLRHYILVSLYTLLPPRRLCYSSCLVMPYKSYKKLSEDEKDNNIYYVTGKRNLFHYGKHKVKSKTKTNETVEVNTTLRNVLKRWIDHHELKENSSLLNISRNALTKQLSNIFHSHGLSKGISASILRKIYISHHESNIKKQIADEDMKELARCMNHSVNVQQNIYTKKCE